MSRETAIELPDDVFDRLSAVAAGAGRSAQSLMREAIEGRLEEWEDVLLAEQSLERRLRGESRTYSLEEVGRDLGLDD